MEQEYVSGFKSGIGFMVGIIFVFGIFIAVYAFVEPSEPPTGNYVIDWLSPLNAMHNDTNNKVGTINTNIGTGSDSASMSSTLFAGQQYIWDNRASFGSTAVDNDTNNKVGTINTKIGTGSDSASMSSTLFAGQQYIWDNRASFGSTAVRGCFYLASTSSTTTGNTVCSSVGATCKFIALNTAQNFMRYERSCGAALYGAAALCCY